MGLFVHTPYRDNALVAFQLGINRISSDGGLLSFPICF